MRGMRPDFRGRINDDNDDDTLKKPESVAERSKSPAPGRALASISSDVMTKVK